MGTWESKRRWRAPVRLLLTSIRLQALGFIPAGVDPIAAGLLPPLTSIFSQITAKAVTGRRVDIDAVLSELSHVSANYPFRIPPYFFILLRAFSVIEGIGIRADPSFSIVDECFPYIARRVLSDDSPRMQVGRGPGLAARPLWLAAVAANGELRVRAEPAAAGAVRQQAAPSRRTSGPPGSCALPRRCTGVQHSRSAPPTH